MEVFIGEGAVGSFCLIDGLWLIGVGAALSDLALGEQFGEFRADEARPPSVRISARAMSPDQDQSRARRQNPSWVSARLLSSAVT